MKFRNTGSYKESAATKPAVKKRASGLYIDTLEYNMLAGLVTQQYEAEDVVNYNALLSIPLGDRIPGLMEKYGKKTVHKLLIMILKEFCNSVPLPRNKKLTETKISMAACELMLTSGEDYLGLEDVILFLQRVKRGKYGSLNNLTHPALLFTMLEQYRQARHDCYKKNTEYRETEQKLAEPTMPRIAPEPTAIGDILHKGYIIDISTRKMSG